MYIDKIIEYCADVTWCRDGVTGRVMAGTRGRETGEAADRLTPPADSAGAGQLVAAPVRLCVSHRLLTQAG